MHFVLTSDSRLELSRALHLMLDALDVLDQAGAPGEVGSTLDLAIMRLLQILGRNGRAGTGLEALMSRLLNESDAAAGGERERPSPWPIAPS